MRYLFVVACGGLIACSSTYHPEYHPVTVTQVSQDVSYPVTVNNGTPEQRSQVVISPPTVQPLVVPPPRVPTPPPGWPTE